MAKKQPDNDTVRQSRRSFLAKLGLGAAAAATVTIPGAALIAGADQNLDQEFPDESSIFHPAFDPRNDPRRPESQA